MKCGQLIAYSMTKFFLKNHAQNVVEKLIPDTFLEMQNWVYLWISCVKFNTACFYCMSRWRLSKYIATKVWTTCFDLKKSVFEKQKEVCNLSPRLIFCMIYSKKYFSCYIVLPTKFHYLVSFTSWDIGQYVYCNCLLTRLWHRKFWNLPHFSNQAIFLYDRKVKTKFKISWERKQILR